MWALTPPKFSILSHPGGENSDVNTISLILISGWLVVENFLVL